MERCQAGRRRAGPISQNSLTVGKPTESRRSSDDRRSTSVTSHLDPRFLGGPTSQSNAQIIFNK